MDATLLLIGFRSAPKLVDRSLDSIGAGSTGMMKTGILSALADTPGIRSADIAKALRIGRSNMTFYLGELENEGLLRREHDPGRITKVFITPKGRKILGEMRANLKRVASYFWGDLPPEDIEAAGRVLKNLMERAP